MGEKKGSFEQRLNSSVSRGFNSYDDLRPTTLTRETQTSFSNMGFSDPVYRSLSNQDDLRSTPLSSSFRDSDLSRPSNRSFDTDLSRPLNRSLIHSTPSSHIFPPELPSSKKSTSFVSRVPYDIQIQSSALSSKDLPLPVEPPPVPGGYLEPFYHIVSHSKPTYLFDLILQILHSLLKQKLICYGIDMETIAPKFKVKCVGYPPGELKLQFVCRVFRMDPDEQGKRYALEFQRRSGCVIQFSNLWTKCKRLFQETGLLADKSAPPKTLATFAGKVTEADIRQTLRCLLQMATSKYCDVKSQAIAVLCKMSAEEQQKSIMIEEEGCVEAFQAAVGCPDEDIHRCAVSALANLNKRADVC